MSLVLVVALPFIASILAALLPSDARNRESTLAGLVALGCAGYIAWLLWGGEEGKRWVGRQREKLSG